MIFSCKFIDIETFKHPFFNNFFRDIFVFKRLYKQPFTAVMKRCCKSFKSFCNLERNKMSDDVTYLCAGADHKKDKIAK